MAGRADRARRGPDSGPDQQLQQSRAAKAGRCGTGGGLARASAARHVVRYQEFPGTVQQLTEHFAQCLQEAGPGVGQEVEQGADWLHEEENRG